MSDPAAKAAAKLEKDREVFEELAASDLPIADICQDFLEIIEEA